ncbi:MAG: Gfo/Idh/MocA family oxidoreductase, partial [Planctomycetes bacterium]|nr:Gfo/Idh/MocA family oxidoreductase [Planctomycetota bacterium]
ARAHLNGYKALRQKGYDRFVISAVCDPVHARGDEFAKLISEFQTDAPKVFTSVDALLKAKVCSAADICTPHFDHHQSAVPCLDAGVDVMVEKPIGITVRASRKIIEAGEKRGCIVATAENVRRYIGERAMRWAVVEQKMIGDLRMFFVQGTAWSPPDLSREATQWRVDRLYSGGGPVMDSGAHYMDTVRHFFGDVDTLFAHARTFEKLEFAHPTRGQVAATVEDSWMATFKFKSGLIGVWSFSRSAPGTPFKHALYYGSEGSMEDKDLFHHFCWTDGELTFKDGKKKSLKDIEVAYLLTLSEEQRQRLFPFGLTDGFSIECWDFVEACAHRRRPEVDGWDGLKAKAMSEAIYESSLCGQAVKVDDVLAGKVEAYQRPINELWKL